MPDLLVHVIEARNLVGLPDSYPVFKVGGRKAKGKIKSKNPNPQWDQFLLLNFNSAHPMSEHLTIELYNRQRIGKDYCLGECKIPLEIVTQSIEHQSWHILSKKGGEVGGEILVGVSGVDFGSQSNKRVDDYDSSPMNSQDRVYGQPPTQQYYQQQPYPQQHYQEQPYQQQQQYYPQQTPTYSPMAHATPVYIIDESTLSPEQRKKLKKQRRWRRALTVTGTVCMVLITALGFVFLGVFLC